MCLYSCHNHLARKSHLFCSALYCHLWPVLLYHIFPRYLKNGVIFGEKNVWNIKCLFFLYNFFSETFLFLRRIQRGVIVNTHRPSCKVPMIIVGQVLIKLEFSRQIFEKYSNIKSHENPSSWSRVVPCGQTGMTKLIIDIRNF